MVEGLCHCSFTLKIRKKILENKGQNFNVFILIEVVAAAPVMDLSLDRFIAWYGDDVL